MTVWQFCLCAGLAFLIAEIFFPATFFLSMSVGAFLTAVISVWFSSETVLIVSFAVLSVLSLLIFRPFLAKYKKETKEDETGIEGRYIGKRAKVIKDINDDSGAISIYDERWEARPENKGEIFAAGEEAEIVRNDSLVMYVRKISN